MKTKAIACFICLGFYACSSISEKDASIILQAVAEKAEQEVDISGDLLIMDARNYYVKKKKIVQAALACYYCGRMYLQRSEYDPALNDFLEAEKYAMQIHNYELLALIYYYMGVMYKDQLLADKAMEKLQVALQTIQTHSIKFDKKFELYDAIAISHIFVSNIDSAIVYYNKALQFASNANDTIKQSIATRHIGFCYLSEELIDSAKIYLYKSVIFTNTPNATSYYNLAQLYYAESNQDSVIHFINLALDLALEEKDNVLCSNLYKLLFQMEKDAGNYYQAFEYQELYTDYLSNIFKEKQTHDLLISESRYNYEQTQNKNKQLLIERQYILLAVLALIIIVISISFYYFGLINQQKSRALELEKASLEAEQQIQTLRNMAAGFDDKEQSLRMEALSHFEILKKVALLREDEQLNAKTSGYKRSPMERINEIVYGSIQGFDWDTFFNSIRTNALYKNMFDTIHQKDFFKDLDDIDQRICYLTCMDFGNSEIATLLGCSLRTIEQRKTDLRKNLDIPTRKELKKHLL